MDLNLRGKSVIVTASAHGLGKSIARGFLEEGAKVLISDIDEKRADATLKEFAGAYGADRVGLFMGDLTGKEAAGEFVRQGIARFGGIDVLVANLGTGRGSIDWRIEEEDWARMMDMNFNGARRITNEVVPHMIEKGRGAIVYISSIAGVETIGAPIHYSVAKASLIALSKNLSRKLARSGIRVNTVCPGNIYFEEGTWDFKLRENRAGVLDMLDKSVPMNRLAAPEEIADVVLFLASERASFVTGSCIIADGGQTVAI